MRHWVEEAGGTLRRLYERPARFEVFRYLLNLLAKLVPLGALRRPRALAGRAGSGAAAARRRLAVAGIVGVSEIVSRSLLGRDPRRPCAG
jgi:hypothetical protein